MEYERHTGRLLGLDRSGARPRALNAGGHPCVVREDADLRAGREVAGRWPGGVREVAERCPGKDGREREWTCEESSLTT